MKKHLIIIFLLFSFSDLYAQESLRYYIQKALENNLQLNAERKNFESSKQSKNISRSEFYQVLHYQEINPVLRHLIELIKVE